MSENDLIRYGVTILVAAVVLGLRVRRMARTRPLKLKTLWIVPLLYLAGLIATFVAQPPSGSGWLWIATALAGGAAVGWWRGKLTHIAVDPETLALDHRASPAAIVLLAAIMLVRNLARQGFSPGAAAAVLVGDAMIAFGFTFFSVGRLEMALRARRLLSAARQGAGGGCMPGEAGVQSGR